MNKITISNNEISSDNNIEIKNNVLVIQSIDDINIIIENSDIDLKINVKCPCKIFEYIKNSKVNNTYYLENNLDINRFSINSTISTDIEINKEYVKLNYAYKTINIDDNNYIVNVKHNAKNTSSNIVSYGINYKDGKLDFLINSIIPKNSTKVISNQDSKIILLGKNKALIKPNLLVDNDDIEANHASFIGYLNKDRLFYLKSRGINEKNSTKLLLKAFIFEKMDLTFLQREMILKDIDIYWR